MNRRRRMGTAVFLCCGLSATQAAATTYSFTTVDFVPSTPFPSFVGTHLTGINNSGQIIGYASTSPNYSYYQAVFTAGAISNQNLVSGFSPAGINNSGQLVGSGACPGTGATSGLIDTNGSFTCLTLGTISTQATAINDLGQVVGRHTGSVGIGPSYYTGFLDTAGAITTIDISGSSSVLPTGINNAGEIVGTYQIINGRSVSSASFIDNGGLFTDFRLPGAASTDLYGVNNAGQLVGTANFDAGAYSGFVYSGASYDLINVPGAGYTFADGINDLGQVVGFYGDPVTGVQHGFIATPFATAVPEASSFAILGIGLIGLMVPGLFRRSLLAL